MSNLSTLMDLVFDVAGSVGKVSISTILQTVFFALPAIVKDLAEFKGQELQDKIDEACNEIDRLTGEESTAFDIIRNLPPDKEELLFDSIHTIIGIVAKHFAKVEGFYIPSKDEAAIKKADGKFIRHVAVECLTKVLKEDGVFNSPFEAVRNIFRHPGMMNIQGVKAADLEKQMAKLEEWLKISQHRSGDPGSARVQDNFQVIFSILSFLLEEMIGYRRMVKDMVIRVEEAAGASDAGTVEGGDTQ